MCTKEGVQITGHDGGGAWSTVSPIGEITYQLVGSTWQGHQVLAEIMGQGGSSASGG